MQSIRVGVGSASMINLGVSTTFNNITHPFKFKSLGPFTTISNPYYANHQVNEIFNQYSLFSKS